MHHIQLFTFIICFIKRTFVRWSGCLNSEGQDPPRFAPVTADGLWIEFRTTSAKGSGDRKVHIFGFVSVPFVLQQSSVSTSCLVLRHTSLSSTRDTETMEETWISVVQHCDPAPQAAIFVHFLAIAWRIKLMVSFFRTLFRR
jgi:hypothetical protein